MTTNEMIEYIADTLNVSGSDALSRIGRELNVRYRQVTSSIGMAASRRIEVSKNSTIGSQSLTFTGIEKLEAVYRKLSPSNKPVMLALVTPEEMLDAHMMTGYPTAYSVDTIAPDSVTIKVNCLGATPPFTLYGMSVQDVSTLTNLDRPQFPDSYHDVLIQGVLADEYKRKEKGDMAKDAEDKFQQRLSDLRMFLAKNAYLNVYRGKHAKAEGWWDTSVSTEGQFGIIP